MAKGKNVEAATPAAARKAFIDATTSRGTLGSLFKNQFFSGLNDDKLDALANAVSDELKARKASRIEERKQAIEQMVAELNDEDLASIGLSKV